MIRYMSFHKNIIQLFYFKKKMSLDLMLFRNFILGKKTQTRKSVKIVHMNIVWRCCSFIKDTNV